MECCGCVQMSDLEDLIARSIHAPKDYTCKLGRGVCLIRCQVIDETGCRVQKRIPILLCSKINTVVRIHTASQHETGKWEASELPGIDRDVCCQIIHCVNEK